MSKGQRQDGLAAARAELAARDDVLGGADRALTDVVSAAVTQATDAIWRIEAVQAEIDTTVFDGTDLENRERARRLLHRQREITAIITETSAEVSAKTTELQRIIEIYQSAQR